MQSGFGPARFLKPVGLWPVPGLTPLDPQTTVRAPAAIALRAIAMTPPGSELRQSTYFSRLCKVFVAEVCEADEEQGLRDAQLHRDREP